MPPEVIDLIRAIASHLPEAVGQVLVEQAEGASAVAETRGCDIDVIVSDAAPNLQLPDGPVHVIPAVLDESGVQTGEVIIWVEEGSLIGVERPWFMDAAPDLWPGVAALDFGGA